MTATIIPSTLAVETAPVEAVTHDLYINIHKGIRTELFGVTQAYGSVDPANDAALEGVTARLQRLVELLVSHAEHEDTYVQPWIEQYAPGLAAAVPVAHEAIEHQMASLEVLADRALGSRPDDRRLAVHRVYLGAASFTADYLQHQAYEELEIMPALSQALPFDKLVAIEQELVASIPPEDMAYSMALMVPSMNIEDRVGVFGGMKMGAPPEVFKGIFTYVGTLIPGDEYVQLKSRLGE